MNRKKSHEWIAGLMGILLLLVPAAAISAPSGEANLISRTVVSGTVNHAVEVLGKMVADNGMMVMGELHQGKVLEMTGLRVKSETVFVGNPNVGKKLFGIEPGAGLVLPVRVNIFENDDGKTVVAYIPPSRQLAGFGNPKLTRAAEMLDQKLSAMVGMLGK